MIELTKRLHNFERSRSDSVSAKSWINSNIDFIKADAIAISIRTKFGNSPAIINQLASKFLSEKQDDFKAYIDSHFDFEIEAAKQDFIRTAETIITNLKSDGR